MKSRIKFFAAFVFILLCTVTLSAQDTYNLNYKYEKGKTYFYRIIMNMDIVQSMNGQDMNINMESKSKLRLEVVDTKDDKFEMISSLDSMYSKSNNPMGGDDIINNGEGTVGKKTKIFYDKFGKLIQKIAIDQSSNALNMNYSGSSEGIFRLSDKPVKMGDNWTINDSSKISIGEGGGMNLLTACDCRLEGKEMFNGKECLKILYTQKIAMNGAVSQAGMDMVIDGTGNSKGVFYYDIAKGLVINNDASMEMNATIAIGDQGMTMPMTQKMKSSISLLDN